MTESLLDGRYRLISPLAEGGMSVVWRGQDDVLARPVAVKVIRADAGSDNKGAQRVRREATALARLNHGHIASVYDYGESDLDGSRRPYLVMELVEGESLGAVLRRGHIEWPTAVAIAAQVAGALAAAHGCGVVHCDVTPGNVMLAAEGVKIIDFGIACTAGDNADALVFGTPAYLAPERRAGGCAVPASDVYGLGLLLYEMLAGRLPWPDGTATEVVAAHRNVPPAPLPEVAGLPPRVRALCAACLAVEPSQRPSSRELQICLTAIWQACDPDARHGQAVRTTIREPAPATEPAGAAVRSIGPVSPPYAVSAPHSPVPHGFDATGVRPAAAVDAARGGRKGSRTRIMPHGMTSVPDPGLATQPIEEEPRPRRRAFFALPSLLLLALIVGFGMSDVRASGGLGTPMPAPSVQPERPHRPVAPTPPAAPDGGLPGAAAVPPGSDGTGSGSDAAAGQSPPTSGAGDVRTDSPTTPKHSPSPRRSHPAPSGRPSPPEAAPPSAAPPSVAPSDPPPSGSPSPSTEAGGPTADPGPTPPAPGPSKAGPSGRQGSAEPSAPHSKSDDSRSDGKSRSVSDSASG
ncbi:MAG TPA: protein kinase [Micromonosporaceae bacterium]|jgi:serine/threonine-protein kinase|nr:protein kinase [Micromonosporaceae bacterium]